MLDHWPASTDRFSAASDYHYLVDIGIAECTVREACSQAQVLEFGMARFGLGFLEIDGTVNQLEVLEQGMRTGQRFNV